MEKQHIHDLINPPVPASSCLFCSVRCFPSSDSANPIPRPLTHLLNVHNLADGGDSPCADIPPSHPSSGDNSHPHHHHNKPLPTTAAPHPHHPPRHQLCQTHSRYTAQQPDTTYT